MTAKNFSPLRDWQVFEDLCRDLWSRLWDDPNAVKLGRTGQEQRGVDVFGRPGQGMEWAGVQCKLKTEGQLTRREIADEVRKARGFNPRLSDYVVATTARRNAGVQEWAREITAEQLKEGSFPVTVWAWDDLCERLGDHPDLVRRYFSELTLPEPPPTDAPRFAATSAAGTTISRPAARSTPTRWPAGPATCALRSRPRATFNPSPNGRCCWP